MGADIHAYIELFDGDRWTWATSDLFPDNDTRIDKPWDPFPSRSYSLFGFLAGVRDPDVPQIHECRGLPADLSPELRKEFGFTWPQDCTHYDPDFHGRRNCMCLYSDSGLFAHSWATGAELLAYDYVGTFFPCPYAHGAGRQSWREPCAHLHEDQTTVGEYLGGWVERFQSIAALSHDPSHVRAVYAFDT